MSEEVADPTKLLEIERDLQNLKGLCDRIENPPLHVQCLDPQLLMLQLELLQGATAGIKDGNLNKNESNERIISEGQNPELVICEPHLRGECFLKDGCGLNHYGVPYLWQIFCQQRGWLSLPPEVVVNIEMGYCQRQNNLIFTQMLTICGNAPINNDLAIDFLNMKAEFKHPLTGMGGDRFFNIRRLSTPSYALCLIAKKEEGSQMEVTDAERITFLTQWRWYYQDPSDPTGWMPFEYDGLTPHQAVTESKFLASQEVFMFHVERANGTMCIALNYKAMIIKDLKSKQVTQLRRRPLFVEQNDVSMLSFLPWPAVHVNPFAHHIPMNWYPLVANSEFELVPLNPEKMEYHLVAGEFSKSLREAKIVEIYRLQNPFLWNKYHCKRMQLERKDKKRSREIQAFHGTDNEDGVRSIMHQNFDSRLAGKNATKFGHGCYFAKDPEFSDRYTKVLSTSGHRTMFLARVLIGKACVGKESYRRPPPIDPKKPFGELFDSCVDQLKDPRIFVTFDSDQCYPEYVINYNRS